MAQNKSSREAYLELKRRIATWISMHPRFKCFSTRGVVSAWEYLKVDVDVELVCAGRSASVCMQYRKKWQILFATVALLVWQKIMDTLPAEDRSSIEAACRARVSTNGEPDAWPRHLSFLQDELKRHCDLHVLMSALDDRFFVSSLSRASELHAAYANFALDASRMPLDWFSELETIVHEQYTLHGASTSSNLSESLLCSLVLSKLPQSAVQR